MDRETSFTLIRRVLDRLESGSRKIDGETYTYLVDCISESMAETNEGSSEALDELEDYTYAARMYRHAGRLEGFDIGACWGMMRIREAQTSAAAEKQNAQLQEELAKKYQDILQVIHDNPSITQTELAKKTNNSRSNLSQILSRIKPYCLFVTSIEGRNKHYRLTARGKELLGSARRRYPRNYEQNPESVPDLFVVGRFEYFAGEIDRGTGRATVTSSGTKAFANIFPSEEGKGQLPASLTETSVKRLPKHEYPMSFSMVANNNQPMAKRVWA